MSQVPELLQTGRGQIIPFAGRVSNKPQRVDAALELFEETDAPQDI